MSSKTAQVFLWLVAVAALAIAIGAMAKLLLQHSPGTAGPAGPTGPTGPIGPGGGGGGAPDKLQTLVTTLGNYGETVWPVLGPLASTNSTNYKLLEQKGDNVQVFQCVRSGTFTIVPLLMQGIPNGGSMRVTVFAKDVEIVRGRTPAQSYLHCEYLPAFVIQSNPDDLLTVVISDVVVVSGESWSARVKLFVTRVPEEQ